jgi:putative ABC transport system permease protein
MSANAAEIGMSGFLNDLRFSLRQLVKRPGFAAAAILTLALGIGANTAVFSILNGYLLKPLPYPHGAELAQVNALDKLSTRAHPISAPIYHDIQKHTHAFAAMGLYREEPFDLHMGGHAERVSGLAASASLFHVLGVQPLLGHMFTTKNMHKGSNLVMVLSYGLWQSVFGGDPRVVGKTIHTVGERYRIIYGGPLAKRRFPHQNPIGQQLKVIGVGDGGQ